MNQKILRGALFLLPVLVLLPHLGDVPFGRGQAFTDFLVSHYPNTLFLQRSVAESASIPLWSPLILSGYPFAANPLSGLFYPPGWLGLLFPLPLGLNLLVVLHLIWGGVGMYRLLRLEGVGEFPSLFGALSFEALPKLFNHLGAGHITLIYAVSWTPWLLYSERRFSSSARTRWLAPGAVLGLIALADIRWAAYAGLFWLAYALWVKRQALINVDRTAVKRFWLGWFARIAGKAAFALLTAAPLTLPLAQYARLSTRSTLTPHDNLLLSLPPGNLLGLVYPAIGGAPEWTVYTGGVVLALVIFSASKRDIRTRAAFWLAGAVLTLLYALGSYLPWMEFVTELPGMSLLRVPPRVIFFTGLCLCAAAAYGLDALVRAASEIVTDRRDRSPLVLFAVTTFVVLLAAAAIVVLREPDQQLARVQFAWGAGALALATILIFAARSRKIAARTAAVLLLALALVDSISLNSLSLEFHSPREIFAHEAEVVQFLTSASDGAPYRVYSPTYSLPQHIGAFYNIEQADGVDPLQLSAYSDFMQDATGVRTVGYSVTLPAFSGGNPAEDNRSAIPDARLLGLLNVRFVVSAFPILADGLTERWHGSDTYIYENAFTLPRAWIEQKTNTPDPTKSVSIIERSPNHFDVEAQGPGLLVLSEVAYPGWQVTVDGAPAVLETVHDILRGVRLEAGPHQIRFVFRPWLVFLGVLIGLAAWVGWAVALRLLRRRGD